MTLTHSAQLVVNLPSPVSFVPGNMIPKDQGCWLVMRSQGTVPDSPVRRELVRCMIELGPFPSALQKPELKTCCSFCTTSHQCFVMVAHISKGGLCAGSRAIGEHRKRDKKA